MSEVKAFKLVGEVMKPNFLEPMKFTKTIQAARKEHAIERLYADMGSRHHAKRYHIKILSVEELKEADKQDIKEEG